MGLLTEICITLLGAFLIADSVAHFTRYAFGETFSAWIGGLEFHRWYVRVLVFALCQTLCFHLVFFRLRSK